MSNRRKIKRKVVPDFYQFPTSEKIDEIIDRVQPQNIEADLKVVFFNGKTYKYINLYRRYRWQITFNKYSDQERVDLLMQGYKPVGLKLTRDLIAEGLYLIQTPLEPISDKDDKETFSNTHIIHIDLDDLLSL